MLNSTRAMDMHVRRHGRMVNGCGGMNSCRRGGPLPSVGGSRTHRVAQTVEPIAASPQLSISCPQRRRCVTTGAAAPGKVASGGNDNVATNAATLLGSLGSLDVAQAYDLESNDWSVSSLSVVVVGASGDLAKKKIFPALFALYYEGSLPQDFQIYGYARSKMTDPEFRDLISSTLTCRIDAKERCAEAQEKFLKRCFYQAGAYDTPAGYQDLNTKMAQQEGIKPRANRMFFFSIPPNVFIPAAAGAADYCSSRTGWTRVIVEKPFGRDSASSRELSAGLARHLREEQTYRIDHYLGKELIENLTVLRFSNLVFEPLWSRQYIRNVQVIFSENFGTEGRGGYFDQYGIVRDVIQNHLLQVLALLMMEPPVSMHPDDVRDEKVKLLRSVREVDPADCVIGQYVAGNGYPGYLDDPTVPRGSKQATYAAVRLHIHNERWAGVPIMIKAGKALNERLVAVRMQLKTPAASIFGNLENMRNELVIKFQPGEAIYIKLVVKTPGLDMNKEMSELELTYPERYKHLHIPDAYERLILDCIRGDAQHFVRRDELRAAWAIFTPLLHAIERGELQPEPYEYGSRGPASIDEWTAKGKYIKTEYQWQDPKTKL
mmetsp:Transcript_20290/g.44307  ORF Transcript_20290/g.44307 Transcript_20290/m.44307 type:complete len:604 (-) Transcript_20290:1435-3246(-)